MNPVRSLLVLVVALLLLVPTSDAHACGGAILRDLDSLAAKLREAERSLEDGDLRWARSLAREVADGDEELFYDRARRIEALSFARDPYASDADLTKAAVTLGELAKKPEGHTPALDADFAEAAARLPKFQDEARRQLLSLSDRDLMGSPHAYAALARLADAHGDHLVAKDARARCTTMAIDASVCGPELRRPVLFRPHGLMMGYVGPLAIAAIALLHRLLRKKTSAPWIGFGARAQAAAFGAAGIVVFLLSRQPAWAMFVMLAASVLTVTLERRMFFRAVRAGRVFGYALRPAVDEDPKAGVKLHFGPREDETLERVAEDAPDGGYRIAARRPVVRMARRPLRQTIGSALAFGVVLLIGATVLPGIDWFGEDQPHGRLANL